MMANERRCPLSWNQSVTEREAVYGYICKNRRDERGTCVGLPEYCDITTGRQPGIALANIHRRMERVCGRRMLDGVYISNVAGS